MGEIVRVFRVIVPMEKHEEFEVKFATVSVEAVERAQGSLGCIIGKPTKWAPEEYVMISRWRNVESLIGFAGESWNEAHIPAGMEPFIESCQLHHYTAF